MINLRNFFKTYFTPLIADAGEFEFFDAIVGNAVKTSEERNQIVTQVMRRTYADVGGRTPVPASAQIKIWALCGINANDDADLRLDDAEYWSMKLFKHVKANRAFGTSWIKVTRCNEDFLEGITTIGTGNKAYSMFDVHIEYNEDLSDV